MASSGRKEEKLRPGKCERFNAVLGVGKAKGPSSHKTKVGELFGLHLWLTAEKLGFDIG